MRGIVQRTHILVFHKISKSFILIRILEHKEYEN